MLGFVNNALGFLPADFQTISTLIGLGFMIYFLIKVWKFISMYFLASAVDPKKFGEWAVVTGCTDGIGRAMAEELAKKGMKLILVSRNPQTLKAQAQEFGI
jgi:17beta-estradiol 17-dehydrogenase / very-long-chain 3-oxoacyl-CoA reductase